jgi:hypothetical protein
MLRIAHCLDSRLTDSGELVNYTHRPRSNLQKSFFFISAFGTNLFQSLGETQGLVRPEGLAK